MSERKSLLPNTPRNVISGQNNGIVTDRRRPCTKRFAVFTVLACETFERIAFYGITGNLVLFLNMNPMLWTSYNAVNALYVFMGLSFILCLLGGWIADSCMGKWKTIVFSFLIYILGYIFFPIMYPHPTVERNQKVKLAGICGTVIRNESQMWVDWTDIVSNKTVSPLQVLTPIMEPRTIINENCSLVVYISLTLVAIGSGFIKTNIAPYGGDQVKSEGQESMRAFFNWFYWAVNIGSFVALTGVAFLQQEVSFFWGYITPCIFLALALIIILIGRPASIGVPATGSVIRGVYHVVKEGFLNSRKKRKSRQNINSIIETSGTNDGDDLDVTWLDYAKVGHGGNYQNNVVDDVKTLGRIVLIFATLIPYWLVYFQMETTFLVQGLHMKLSFARNYTNNNDFKMPAAALSLFDVAIVIILIPIMERFVYPALDRTGRPLSMTMRMIIGMVFAILSMMVAGGVELVRLKRLYPYDNMTEVYSNQTIGSTSYQAADMAIWYQIPQYALIGLSEVFTSIAGLELAYSQAPGSMKSLIMGLFWFFSGIGSFLGTVLMLVLQGTWFFTWDSGDINCRIPCPEDPKKVCHQCHLDYYFYLLGGVQAFGLILFLVVSWKLNLGKFTTKRARSPGNAMAQTLRHPARTKSSKVYGATGTLA